MPFKALTPSLSVSPQLTEADVAEAARNGFRAIIDNRPDGEEPGQPTAAEMKAMATAHGLGFAHVPTVGGKISDEDVALMAHALADLEGPVLAYCRTGTRSTTLWALTQAGAQPADGLIATGAEAGYDISTLRPRLETRITAPTAARPERADVVIVGGGSAGLATAASLLERDRNLDIVVIEPRERGPRDRVQRLPGRIRDERKVDLAVDHGGDNRVASCEWRGWKPSAEVLVRKLKDALARWQGGEGAPPVTTTPEVNLEPPRVTSQKP
jgi:sulfide:quinone oxidoreductase